MSARPLRPLSPRPASLLDRFSSDCRVREAASGAGRWVTLHGGEDDSEGGGVHVWIASGGVITKGPRSLLGGNIKHLGDHKQTHHPPGHEPPGARAHPQYTEHQPPEKPAPLPGKPYARLHGGAPQTRQEQPKEGPEPLTKEQTHAGLATARDQAKQAKAAKAATPAESHEEKTERLKGEIRHHVAEEDRKLASGRYEKADWHKAQYEGLRKELESHLMAREMEKPRAGEKWAQSMAEDAQRRQEEASRAFERAKAQPKPLAPPLTREQQQATDRARNEALATRRAEQGHAKAADTAVAHQQAQADLAAYRASKDRNPNPWAPHLSPPVNDAKDRELQEKATRAQLAHQAVQAQQQQAAAAEQQEGQRAHDKEMVRLKADVAPKPAITRLPAKAGKPSGGEITKEHIQAKVMAGEHLTREEKGYVLNGYRMPKPKPEEATAPQKAAAGPKAAEPASISASARMADKAAAAAQKSGGRLMDMAAQKDQLRAKVEAARAAKAARTRTPAPPPAFDQPTAKTEAAPKPAPTAEEPPPTAAQERARQQWRATAGRDPEQDAIDAVQMSESKRQFFRENPELLDRIKASHSSGHFGMTTDLVPSRRLSDEENAARRKMHVALNQIGMLTRNPAGGTAVNPGIWHAGQKYLREQNGVPEAPTTTEAPKPAAAEQPKAEARGKPALTAPQKPAEKPATTEPAQARGHVVKDPARGDHFLVDHPDAVAEYGERAARARAYNQRYPDAHRSMKDSAAEYDPATHHVLQRFDKQGRVERTFHVAKDDPHLARTQPVSGKDVPLSIRKHQDLQERLRTAGSTEERVKVHARQRYDPLPMAERAIAKADKPDIVAEGRANTAAQLAEGARRYAERGTSGYEHLSDPTHPIHEEIQRAAPTFGQRNAHIGRIQALTQARHKMEDAFAKVAGRGAAAAEHPLKAEHDQALARIAARIAHHSARADALRPAADAESAAVAKILAKYAPAAKKSKVRESASPAPRFVAPLVAAAR